MRIVIAGGHGKIALQLGRLLSERDDEVVALIRNPQQTADVEATGASAQVVDLESSTVETLAPLVAGADAVVFAAGAGPGSGVARKKSVDRDAAILLADAAGSAGVRRYLMVSSIGADSGGGTDDVFAVYLEAKAAADRYLRGTDLDWTIVRPGGLVDADPTGRIKVGATVERDTVTRADVALVLQACLDEQATIGKQFELVNGDEPIMEALRALA